VGSNPTGPAPLSFAKEPGLRNGCFGVSACSKRRILFCRAISHTFEMFKPKEWAFSMSFSGSVRFILVRFSLGV
jgi:hypothetical protein